VFSKRVSFNLQENNLTLLLTRKRRSGTEIIDLTESNPTLVGLEYPEKDVLAKLPRSESLVYSPMARGEEVCRNSISDYYSERGVAVCAKDILLTSSTSEAYSFLFKLLIDPGGQILIPRPSYPLFGFLAQLECARTTTYPLCYQNGWYYDLDTLERCFSSATKAVVLVNPNNPTGTYIEQGQWRRLRELCLHHGTALICDEVFVDYCFSQTSRPFDPLSETGLLSFFLNGLSKTAGLPQMKLSWIVIRGPSEQKRSASEHLEVVADTFLSVNSLVQKATPGFMKMARDIREQILHRIRVNYGFLSKVSAGTAVECLSAQGGWYATLRVPGIKSEEEWALHLLEATNTLVHPGYFYDYEGKAFLVVSLLPEFAVFEEGVQRILGEISAN